MSSILLFINLGAPPQTTKQQNTADQKREKTSPSSMDNMGQPSVRKHKRNDEIESEIRRLRQQIDLERIARSGIILPQAHNAPTTQRVREINTPGAAEYLHLLRFQRQSEDLQRTIRHSERYHSDLMNELRLRCRSISECKQTALVATRRDEEQKRSLDEDELTRYRQASNSSPKMYETFSLERESQAPPSSHAGTTSGPLRCVPVATELDAECLSEYQRLVRLCMEFFESASEDRKCATSRGRHVAPRQVGLRCRFCRDQPGKAKGGVYFPKEVDSVYQSAQNMARIHLLDGCTYIPEKIREQMQKEQAKSKRRSGGKQFWVDATTKLGLYDHDGRLFFKPEAASLKQTTPDELPAYCRPSEDGGTSSLPEAI